MAIHFACIIRTFRIPKIEDLVKKSMRISCSRVNSRRRFRRERSKLDFSGFDGFLRPTRRDETLLETGSLSERRVDLADLYFEKKYRSRRKRRKFLPFRPYSRFQREKISCIASINSIKIVFRGMTVRGRGKERTTRRKAGQKKEATKVAARPNRIRSNLASLGNRRTPTS